MTKCYVCKKNEKRWGDTLLLISGKLRTVCIDCYEKIRRKNIK